MSSLMFGTPALAAIETPVMSAPPVSLGERIFTANCAACHIGGNNIIISEKNLSKEALEKYEMNSIAAIKTQVIGGKNAMPAFGDNLNSAEIEAVARYVLTQSQQDWKRSSVGLQWRWIGSWDDFIYTELLEKPFTGLVGEGQVAGRVKILLDFVGQSTGDLSDDLF